MVILNVCVRELMKKSGLVGIDFEKDLEGIKRFAVAQNP